MRKIAILARNEPRAFVMSSLVELPFTRCSKLPDLEASALLKSHEVHSWPCSAICVLLAPCHTALGIPLLPLHQHRSQSFTLCAWTCYTALSTLSTDLATLSCQTELWQIYISYLPRKDQLESLVTSASFSPANHDVFKNILKNDSI